VVTRAKKEKGSPLTKRELRAITRAISDPRRFEILRHIAEAESCAACTELRTSFPISAATLSHHLKELESAGLITTLRRGKFLDTTFSRRTWQAYLAELQKL
jgi:ArsR family transcriptional regulator